MYLKQPNRTEDAKRELAELATYDRRYLLESKLGEAYLAISGSRSPDYNRAEILLNSNRERFENELTGSWREMYEDLRDHLRNASNPLRSARQQRRQ